MAQGDETTKTQGTDSIFIMEPDEVKNIPADQTITYVRLIVDYQPQKKDSNRVQLTADRDLITYPGELTPCTDNTTTSKILWNSVLITENAKYMCVDVENFYLEIHLIGTNI